MSSPENGYVDALCCACGAVRKVGRYMLPIALNRVLKCEACGTRTMHAYLLPAGGPAGSDWREDANANRENLDHRYDKAGTQPPILSVRPAP